MKAEYLLATPLAFPHCSGWQLRRPIWSLCWLDHRSKKNMAGDRLNEKGNKKWQISTGSRFQLEPVRAARS